MNKYNVDELQLSVNEIKEVLFEINRTLERIATYTDMTAGSTHTLANGYFEYLRNVSKGGEEE